MIRANQHRTRPVIQGQIVKSERWLAHLYRIRLAQNAPGLALQESILNHPCAVCISVPYTFGYYLTQWEQKHPEFNTMKLNNRAMKSTLELLDSMLTPILENTP